MNKIDRIKDIFLGYVFAKGRDTFDFSDVDGGDLSVDNGVPAYDADAVFNEDDEGVSFYLVINNIVCDDDEARLGRFMTDFMEILGIHAPIVHTEVIRDYGADYDVRKCIYFSTDDVVLA